MNQKEFNDNSHRVLWHDREYQEKIIEIVLSSEEFKELKSAVNALINETVGNSAGVSQEETEQLRKEIQELKEEVSQLDIKKLQLEDKISQLECDNQRLECDNQRLECDNRELKSYNQQLESDNQRLEEKVSWLESDNRRLKSDNCILEEKLDNLQKELSEISAEKREFEHKYSYSQNQLENCRRSNAEYQDKNRQLENSLGECRRINIEYQGKIRELEDVLRKSADKLNGQSAEIASLSEDLGYYKKTYSSLEETYGLFRQLESSIADSFRSIINDTSPETFLISGVNIDNISLLFGRIIMWWNRYDDFTLKALVEIFDFFSGKFGEMHSEYTRINAQVGQAFSLDIHTRTSDSKPAGTVRRVIIDGYEYKGKKTKSLVEVG